MMINKKLFPYLLIGLCFFTFSACTSSGSDLDNAERQWQRQGVASYRIEVLVVNSIWHAQTHTITVQNDEVVEADASCIPAPFENGSCQANPFVAEDYTVPGLFAKARAVSEDANPDYLTLRFDPTYHFPSNISFDDPEILDEDWNWTVTSFEVLP